MKEWRRPFGSAPEAVFLICDEDADAQKRESILTWLEAILPRLNWRSHLFLIGRDDSGAQTAARTLVSVAANFVERHGFTTLYGHLPVYLGPEDTQTRVEWEQLLAPARRFQRNAYELLTETRLHILPMIEPSPDLPVDQALAMAEFFSARMALPSFYLPGRVLPGLIQRADKTRTRFYVDPDRKGLPVQLWQSHVLETVLERSRGDERTLLLPCRHHLVVDEKRGGVFSCFKRWEIDSPSFLLSPQNRDDPAIPEVPSDVHCLECIARSALSMRENLRINQREGEGHQAYFKLALAVAARGERALAAELAHQAYELADSDQDRTAALLHKGLCLCEVRDFEKADESLKCAEEYAEDKGLLAYHRGRVQFEWGDYIEALERFEEALASGSPQVPVEDTRFEMALSHIHIEEYPEARSHLERSLTPGSKKSSVSFYLGICDLAEGEIGKALEYFREALSLDPAAEELSPIFFYIGRCLKEMECFEEAVEVLEKAVQADPGDLSNHNLLGFCYYRMKRHEEAVACFRRAVEIDPRSAIDWASLGSNLRDLGRMDEAIEMYERALSLDPTLAFARENLRKLTRQR